MHRLLLAVCATYLLVPVGLGFTCCMRFTFVGFMFFSHSRLGYIAFVLYPASWSGRVVESYLCNGVGLFWSLVRWWGMGWEHGQKVVRQLYGSRLPSCRSFLAVVAVAIDCTLNELVDKRKRWWAKRVGERYSILDRGWYIEIWKTWLRVLTSLHSLLNREYRTKWRYAVLTLIINVYLEAERMKELLLVAYSN